MKNVIQHITSKKPASYRIRILTLISVVEAGFLILFTFWPVHENQKKQLTFEQTQEPIVISDVRITYQGNEPPAPPRPSVPSVAPEYEIVEEEIDILKKFEPVITAEESEFSGYGKAGERNEGPVANPGQPPRLVKIVEPAMPDEARKAGIKAEIWVKFLINEKGNVDEATISRIKMYSDDGNDFKEVSHIGYRIPEVTLSAALEWKFRPARQNGETVKAYSTHVFSYGF